jgi:hypothetical protein
VTIKDALWNGKPISDSGVDIDIHPVNGEWISDDTFVFNSDDPNIEFGLTSQKLNMQARNHLELTLLTTLIPRNAADAIADSVHEDAPVEQPPKKGRNIIKKIGRKIIEKREERMYKDEEWD